MPPVDRLVAGLRCSTVLGELSAYLDNDLSAERRSAIEAHVSACDVCAAFGADFAALVTQIREGLAVPDPVPDAVASRLQAFVDRSAS